jgi:hypothetical protein
MENGTIKAMYKVVEPTTVTAYRKHVPPDILIPDASELWIVPFQGYMFATVYDHVTHKSMFVDWISGNGILSHDVVGMLRQICKDNGITLIRVSPITAKIAAVEERLGFQLSERIYMTMVV